MFFKLFVGLFLAISARAFAQDPTSVIYSHVRKYSGAAYEPKEKVVGVGEAQLIYSPTYILLKNSTGIDTVFLSHVNETTWEIIENSITIKYKKKSETIRLFFCDKLDEKICKHFMRENGWHFRRKTGRKILEVSLISGGLALWVWRIITLF